MILCLLPGQSMVICGSLADHGGACKAWSELVMSLSNDFDDDL